MPILPAVAIKADDIPAGYLALIIAGIKITPNAATVAGPEPEIAAKKHDVTTPTIANPPFLWPTNLLAILISFSEIPAFSIVFPASIKNGIANNANLPILA